MKRATCLLAAAGLVLGALAGCGPKPPPAPEETGLTEAEQWRVIYFGEKIALSHDIGWRSSGLGLRVIKPGSGTPPTATDTVRVHYTGRLKDGTVFDDTRAKGTPADFKVNQLISGWAVAMPLLKPGSRAEIFIPAPLGYGGLRAGKIPPNSGLIFDVELLAVNP